MSDSELELRRRRALYRATHRGSKELDLLLGRYASTFIGSMTGEEIGRLEKLIEAPDPAIAEAIYEGCSLGQTDLDELIVRLRRFHGFPADAADGPSDRKT
jgi:antitoxin CptB